MSLTHLDLSHCGGPTEEDVADLGDALLRNHSLHLHFLGNGVVK
jgi:hypothetical protein